ncbi:FtsX-like permease family protein [bacterium]|nr:FtsX-like permease family protein [bacterium]
MNELKFAFRQLLKNKGFTAVAVLTLALGIGASNTVFSALDAVLFRPLPYPQPDRLVELYETLPDGSLNNSSGGVFLDWREHHDEIDSVAIINPVTRNLRGNGLPERLDGLEATHEFLDVTGLRPILGRGFLPTDDQPGGDNNVVMITEDFWRSHLGGAENIVGSTLRLDQVAHTVVGVLPAGSLPRGVWSPRAAQFVIPAVAHREARGKYSRTFHWAMVYGRLKPGVTIQQADAGLKALKAQLNPMYPGYKRDWSATVRQMRQRLSGGPRPVLLMLMTAVMVLLLIACANVANLLFARARNREAEMSIRAALGASPRRIVRQVLTESLLLAGVAGIVGILVSVWGIQILAGLTANILPGVMVPHLDFRILGFSLLVTGVTGVLFGILPAWQARRPDLNEALKSGSRTATQSGHHRTQSFLVISEVALTVVLLGAAGLLLRSLANAINTDPGFEPDHVLAFDLPLSETRYPNDRARFVFSGEILSIIRALPGVKDAGTGVGVPFGGGLWGERVGRSDQARSDGDPISWINYVSPGYLEALNVRMLAGRTLLATDDQADAGRVIVVNESIARRFFSDENPIDKRLSILGNDWRIVGVVADVPNHRSDEHHEICVYIPHIYNAAPFSIVVRTATSPLALTETIRRTIQKLDPDLPMANTRVLSDAMNDSVNPRRIILRMIGAFAITALVLAGVGLYGVMAYSVAVRRKEMSIRLALGASQTSISGMVIRNAGLLVIFGSILGLAAMVGTGRLLASQLFQVTSFDPPVVIATVALVAIIALAACWLPARRASQVDPMEALRNE